MVKRKIILNARNITKIYGDKQVLDGLNLTLHEGETIALMGESGSGKTTILKCLNLLELPNSGTLSFYEQEYFTDSKPIFEPYEIRRNIGLVFQDFNLFPNLTCLRNITLGLIKVLGKSNIEAKKIALDMAEKLNILDIMRRYPDSLSGGQAQRLSIARALVLNPKIILLDEITSALDPNTTFNVIEAIREIKNINSDLSIIVVTHVFEFAKSFADQIGMVANGKIVELLPASEFKIRCSTPESKEYLKQVI